MFGAAINIAYLTDGSNVFNNLLALRFRSQKMESAILRDGFFIRRRFR